MASLGVRTECRARAVQSSVTFVVRRAVWAGLLFSVYRLRLWLDLCSPQNTLLLLRTGQIAVLTWQ